MALTILPFWNLDAINDAGLRTDRALADHCGRSRAYVAFMIEVEIAKPA